MSSFFNVPCEKPEMNTTDNAFGIVLLDIEAIAKKPAVAMMVLASFLDQPFHLVDLPDAEESIEVGGSKIKARFVKNEW